MSIIAKVSGQSYTPCPAGAHSAVCCDVVDLGVLKVSFGGKDKMQHKIRIVWQVEEENVDHKPFLVHRRYTLSLHEKASLRRDLESWRGKPFTEEELQGFDLERLISVPCMLNVIHSSRDGDTYANVTAVMRLPKGMQAISIRDYIRVQDRTPDSGANDPPPDDFITDDDVPF